MKVLAIGNSFSQDATAYLSMIAKRNGTELKVVNLYVGGCSLEQHCIHLRNNIPAYLHETNGCSDKTYCTIDDALVEDDWDIIVTQQVSHDSGWINTYRPFAAILVEHIRERKPGARIFFHQTWAYEIGSPHPNFPRYHCDQAYMYAQLDACCREITMELGLPMIRTGEVIQTLRSTNRFDVRRGGESLCRDAFHMSYTVGRYAAACTWFATFSGIKAEEQLSNISEFKTENGNLSREDIQLIHKCVNAVCFQTHR